MHACYPVDIVHTHENIVNEFIIKEEMKEKEKRNYNDILYNGGSGPPLENSNFSNSHRKIPVNSCSLHLSIHYVIRNWTSLDIKLSWINSTTKLRKIGT